MRRIEVFEVLSVERGTRTVVSAMQGES